MLEFIRKTLSKLLALTLALGIFTIACMLIFQPRLVSANESKKKKSGGFGNTHISIQLKKTPKSKKRRSTKKTKRSARKKKVIRKKKVRAIRTTRLRQVLVTFALETSKKDVDAVATKFRLREIANSSINLLDQQLFKFSSRRPVTRARLKQIANDPQVISAQPNYLYRLSAKAPLQYTSKVLQIPAVHKISTGDGINITILDSGVYAKHPALKGVISKQFDTIGKSGIHSNNHGTGIASIIAARGKMIGIAPKAKLMSARVFARDRRSSPLIAETYNLMRGLDWAANQKSAIINMSFAGPSDALFKQAVIAADQEGIVLVAAVGNQGPKKPVAYPAAYDQVLAVTATGIKNRLYRNANRGKQVSLAAPGVNVFVARRTRSYGLMTGTSAAAAHVSAAIAVILQQNPGFKPNQISASLTATAKDLGPRGRDKKFGYGLLNIYQAIKIK